MATTRNPAARSTATGAKPVAPVKPKAKLTATPASRKNAAKPNAKAGKGKPAAKAGTARSTKPAKTADKAASNGKTAKAAKPKLVRDSFSFPKAEYAMLATLKDRAVKVGKAVKKSELLRAGLKALAALPDLAFRTALDALPARKPARPPKN